MALIAHRSNSTPPHVFIIPPSCFHYSPLMFSLFPPHVFIIPPSCFHYSPLMFSLFPPHVFIIPPSCFHYSPLMFSLFPPHVFIIPPSCFHYSPLMFSLFPPHVFIIPPSCFHYSPLMFSLFPPHVFIPSGIYSLNPSLSRATWPLNPLLSPHGVISASMIVFSYRYISPIDSLRTPVHRPPNAHWFISLRRPRRRNSMRSPSRSSWVRAGPTGRSLRS